MQLDPYTFIVTASLVLIVSFVFNLVAKRTSIPSVLLLIILGIALQPLAKLVGIDQNSLQPILEVLGIVGLIMIVLEASLELELKKEKTKLILQSFASAFVGLFGVAFALAAVVQQFFQTDFFVALLYSIPLSIMSSAIVIPSVSSLSEHRKEFMIYESTFSDILGIMFFFFLIGGADADGAKEIGMDIILNISLTIVISVTMSYLLIYLFQKLRSDVKLFLLIAVLLLLYSLGKMMHLSSLVMILVFGLILNNHKLFFRGKLNEKVDKSAIKEIYKNFHTITLESSFVVRTFFFVIFGLTIVLGSLINIQVIVIAVVILLLIFLVRFGLMRVILGKQVMPLAAIAPRGLITILLFFAIPEEFHVAEFDPGILLFVIIISSIVMAVTLIRTKRKDAAEAIEESPIEMEVVDTREEEKAEE